MAQCNVVADISDYQVNPDFWQARTQLSGVFVKATEGIDGQYKPQQSYSDKITKAKAAGLLVGSYHFGRPGSGADQAKYFLATVGDYAGQLLALDCEGIYKQGKLVPSLCMSLTDAQDFVTAVKDKTGRWPGIYCGNDYLLPLLRGTKDDKLSNCWLWLADYNQTPVWPKSIWPNYAFWQYTGDSLGPPPHSVPGIGDGIDRDIFPGSEDDLRAFWNGGGIIHPLASDPFLAQPDAVVAAAPADAPWMVWMRSHIGEVQQTGAKPTQFTIDIFSHTQYPQPLGDSTPESCAATVCAALENTGYASTRSAAAASYVKYGDACKLTPGCIVVYQWADGGHHVNFCDQILDANTVRGLGGNQGHELDDANFATKYIVATRWPVRTQEHVADVQVAPAQNVDGPPGPAAAPQAQDGAVAGVKTVNQAGLTLLRKWEGCVLYAYDDSTAPPHKIEQGDHVGGTLTIGYGHTGPDVTPGLVWTQAQADSALASDVAKTSGSVASSIKTALSGNQFSAIVCFVFNIGIKDFGGSTALKLLNEGNLSGVPEAMMLWRQVTIGGQSVDSPGLINRRAAEIALWNTV
jgi:GH24 family phage-related lysozyme (muramidase)/GH25 family lysozyme M1 (1,4-beta-N-acetylmuramidase)